MSSNIIKMPKKRKIEAPFAASTALPKMQEANVEPAIETTFTETLAIRRFVQFQLDDVKFQLEEMAKTKGLRPAQFKEAKYTAEILMAYLLNTLIELDARLSAQPPLGTA